jgi:hypothetical protein
MYIPRRLTRLLAVAVAVAGFTALAGCDSDSARCPVEGTVLYDGQEVDQGGIAFIPVGDDSDTRFRATGQIVNGHYELDAHHGPTPGKYRVQITWRKKTGSKRKGEGGVIKDVTEQVIPARYNAQTELVVDVQPGRNTLPFDLKK